MHLVNADKDHDSFRALAALLSSMYEADELVSFLEELNFYMFRNAQIAPPKLSPAELGFTKCTTWLYVHYFEIARTDIQFLSRQLEAYLPDSDPKVLHHVDFIRDLRTTLVHYVHSDSAGEEKRRRCASWFRAHCDTAVPETTEHWTDCLSGLIHEALAFFTSICQVLRMIEHDEFRSVVCSQWQNSRLRYHPPEQFDHLIALVAGDLGLPIIDVAKVRRQNYERWQSWLESLAFGYDFDREARRLIEHALLRDRLAPLPIDGSDIMRHFNLKPGPKVGEYLRQAVFLYGTRPCKGAELLHRLELYNRRHLRRRGKGAMPRRKRRGPAANSPRVVQRAVVGHFSQGNQRCQ